MGALVLSLHTRKTATINDSVVIMVIFLRVIVLENGRTVEFDSPEKLLESKGTFYGMARDANLL